MTPRVVVLEAAPTEMNPEGVCSPRAVSSTLAVGWTSTFAVGIPRVVAISLVQIKNMGRYLTFLFWKAPIGPVPMPMEIPGWPELHVHPGSSNGKAAK